MEGRDFVIVFGARMASEEWSLMIWRDVRVVEEDDRQA
jgi:hypothetical protein